MSTEETERAQRPAVTEEQRQGMRNLVDRLRNGEKLAQMFGLKEEELEALEYQAYKLYQKGHYEKANVAALGIVALDADRFVAQMIAGDVALEEFRFRDAVEHLERAHSLRPDITDVQARLGEALIKQGDAKKAEQHLKEAVEKSSDESSSIRRAKVFLRSLAAA